MKHSNLTLALALSLSGTMLSNASYARESISTVSARVSAIETQLTEGVPKRTEELAECGGTFDVVERIPIKNEITGEVYYEAHLPNPSFGGILADSDTKSRWDYGYIDTQLYTNEQGQLACGVVVDLQAIVESVMDISFGRACAATGVAAMSRDAKLEAVHAVCEIADNVARTINSAFWLTVTGAERLEEVIEGGNPESTKGHIADLYRTDVDLLTVSIPDGPASFIAQIKAQALDDPLDALSRGSLLIGTVEIPLAGLLPPVEMVLAELETNGQSLLDTPSQFVATTAALIAEHYLDEILTEALLLEIIEAASRLEFVDADGNQVFEMGLINDGFGPGLNAMGFKLDGSNVITVAPDHVGIEVDSTYLEVGSSSLSLRIQGNTVISASETDVCFPGGVCTGALIDLIDILPADLTQLGDLTQLSSDVTSLNNLVPADLAAQLAVLAELKVTVPTTDTALRASISKIWALIHDAGGVNSRLTSHGLSIFENLNTITSLNTTVNSLKNSIPTNLTSQLSSLNTTQASYAASNVIGKANDLWQLIHGTGQRLARLDQLHRYMFVDTGTGYNGPDGNPATGDGGIFDRMNQTTALLNAAVNAGSIGVSIIGHVPNSIPYVPYISDARLKNNIAPLTSSLENIMLLQGVTHQWNEQAVALGIQEPDRAVLGFIAQEVQQVLPELIYEGTDGYLRVDYPKMMPVVVEGIKEQQTGIADLREEIASLRLQNDQLTAYLCSLDTTAPFCGD